MALRRYVIGLLGAVLACSAMVSGEDQPKKKTTCQQFSKGVVFHESNATGSWHLLHCWAGVAGSGSGCGDRNCLEFQPVTDKERKELSDLLKKNIPDLNWDLIVMKMKIPCSNISNNTHDYFLEKMGDDGFFRTLQKPIIVKPDRTEFLRSPIRMKLVKNEYLAMMDCHERFTFLMAKEPPKDHPLDPETKKMIDAFEHYED